MLGQPVTMLIPQVVGFKLIGQPAGRHHGHRSRADGDGNTAQARRRRQIRGVLRRRPQGPAPRRSRHHRQYVAGVRLDLRDLSHRRGNHSLSRAHRPCAGSNRAGRGLCQGAGTVAHQRCAGGRLHRCGRARLIDGRALARRAEAAAGPRAAAQRQKRVPAQREKDGRGARAQESAGERSRRGQRGRRELRGARRRRVDCRHHQLHQHVESRRFGGCRPARAQCKRPRPHLQTLGEDLARTGLARRHRLSAESRTTEGLGGPRLLYRGLRLHHLHRQLRTLEAGDFRGGQSRRRRRLFRAVGQSKFRGPRASGNQDEFPRLAALGRRLCAGGQLGYRYHHRTVGRGQGRQAGVPQGRLAERA